jgi:hypothetical protein
MKVLQKVISCLEPVINAIAFLIIKAKQRNIHRSMKGGNYIMTANQIAWQNMLESRRSNRAREAETNRANLATEGETKRANLAKEGETNRHNLATEGIAILGHQETVRSNKVKEKETNRHNLATEKVAAGTLTENVRHNKATEGIAAGTLTETVRHNKANEQVAAGTLRLETGKAAVDAAVKLSQAATNAKKVVEEIRHNQATEKAKQSEIDMAKQKLGWEIQKLQNESHAAWHRGELSAAEKYEVDQKIAKLKAETAKITADTAWKTYDKSIELLDSLLPG